MLKLLKNLPELNELVIFKTKELNDSYAIVDLLDYDIDGLLLFSEVSKKRIKSISKELPLNKLEVGVVVRIDAEKKLIDLSRKRVSFDEISKTKDEYYKRKNIESIINEYLLKKEINEQTKKKIIEELLLLFSNENYDIEEFVNKNSSYDPLLIEICKKNIIKKTYKATCIISIVCYSENGVDIIKNSLKQGLTEGIEIFYISSPEYSISFKSSDKDLCINSIQKSIELIKNYSSKTKVSITKEIDFNEINRQDISDQSIL